MAMRLLLVDDGAIDREALALRLNALGYDVVPAASGAEAALKLASQEIHLCLTVARTPGVDGMAVLEAAHHRLPRVPVVVLTGEAGVTEAITALRAGAVDFLPHRAHPDLCAATVRRALGEDRRASNDGFRPHEGAAVIGDHPALRLMLERIDQVAQAEGHALVRGEEGTGTDLIARLMHASSPRGTGPFVVVDLMGPSEAAVEQELFGSEGPEGHAGKIRAAHGGTLFLPNVGQLPRTAQRRLLRVLEEGQVHPAGAPAPVPVDVRIIATTDRVLEPKVQEGAFDEELYYRLQVISVEVPALRARQEDVALLAEHFRKMVNAREGRAVPAFSADVLRRLADHDWPGNVRQLDATIERLVHAAGNRPATLSDLPPSLRADVGDLGVGAVDLPPYGVDLRLLLTRLEDHLIGQALERTGGNKNRAAELLGLNRTTLVEKLRRRNVA